MRKQVYLKDKKAETFRREIGYDEYRQPIDITKATAPGALWCFAKQLSQTIMFEAKQYGSEESRMFIFNPKADIRLGDLIKYRNAWFIVTRADTKNDNNGDVFIYAKEAGVGEIPNPGDIVPYGQ